MSNPNDGTPKPPSAPAGNDAAKKPSALIDLKATEVKDDRAKPASSGAQGTKESGTSVPPTSAATTAAGAATGAKSTAPGAPPKAEPPKQSPTAPAVPRASGLGQVLTHTVAGLVGGLLALLAADTLGSQLGIGQNAARKDVNETVAKRVGELEQRLMTTSRNPDVAPGLQRALAAAEKRISDLEAGSGRLAALESQNTKLAEETKALRDQLAKSQSVDEPRLARLQEQLATLSAAAGTDADRGRIPQLAAITGKLADLEQTLSTQLGQIRRTLGQEIDQRLAPVAQASEAARVGTQRIDRDLAVVKTETARLAERADQTGQTVAKLEQALRGIEQQAAALKAALDGLGSNVASELKSVSRPADVATALTPVTQRMGQLEASLKDVVRSEQERRSSAEQIILALELGNLKRAIDRGGAYATELTSVQKIAGNRLDIAPLARFKDVGVSTIAELASEFRTTANAILDAESTAADAGVVDRLLAGAKSIVRVRKVGHDANDRSAEAIVGRMQEAMKDGRLDIALSEAKLLPDRAQAAARPWLEKVEARHAIDVAIADVDKQLKAAIGGTAAGKGVN